MRNRRSSKRVSINHTIQVDLEGMILSTTLVDISRDGALLALSETEREKVSDKDLGRKVSFRIKPKARPVRQYTGEVIRLYYQDAKPYLAVRFWEKYKELR